MNENDTMYTLAAVRLSPAEDDGAMDRIYVTFPGTYLKKKDDKVISFGDLRKHICGQGLSKAAWKRYAVARAIGDGTLINGMYKVATRTIPFDIPFGTVWTIEEPAMTVESLMKTGDINLVDVRRGLMGFAARAEKADNTLAPGLGMKIIELPVIVRKRVLERLTPPSSGEMLDLFRFYYPEGINWLIVDPEALQLSDLYSMVSTGKVAPPEFIERCMAEPQLEQIVVQNAFSLTQGHLWLVADCLNKCTMTDLLRGFLSYSAQHPGKVPVNHIGYLLLAEYEDLNRDDYEKIRAFLKNERRPYADPITALLLRVGIMARVSDAELVEMLRERECDVLSSKLQGVYEEYNFEPGLEWVALNGASCVKKDAPTKAGSTDSGSGSMTSASSGSTDADSASSAAATSSGSGETASATSENQNC